MAQALKSAHVSTPISPVKPPRLEGREAARTARNNTFLHLKKVPSGRAMGMSVP